MIRTLAVFSCFLMAGVAVAADKPAGLDQSGQPDLKSAGPLAFGPAGVLFVGDPQGAQLYAIEVAAGKAESAQPFKLTGIDAKIAAVLGTKAADILINDMAVQPGTNIAYFSVSRGKGPDAAPAIVTVNTSGDVALLPMEKVNYAQIAISNAPAADAKDRRGASLRSESITDLAFVDERVFIAGLSNEEFASTLRAVKFPFKAKDTSTSVEIYHGAHGAFETRSPVRTFTPFIFGGEPHLLAAYTCTPLVRFPVSELKAGEKLRGTTIAELGNRNRPLDIIAYAKDGKQFLLLANSARGVMKIPADNADKQEGITTKVADTAGLGYETIENLKGVEHLDKQGDSHALLLVRVDGAVNLESVALP